MSWTHQVHSCLNISDIYGCQENPNSLHPSLPNSMKIAFTKLSPRALIAAFPRMRFSIQMKDFSRDWLCAQFEEDKTVTWWCDNCENCDKKSFAVFSRISQSLRAICPLFPFFKRSDEPFLFPIAFISAIVFQPLSSIAFWQTRLKFKVYFSFSLAFWQTRLQLLLHTLLMLPMIEDILFSACNVFDT